METNMSFLAAISGLEGVWLWVLTHAAAFVGGFLIRHWYAKKAEKILKKDLDGDGKIG